MNELGLKERLRKSMAVHTVTRPVCIVKFGSVQAQFAKRDRQTHAIGKRTALDSRTFN